MTSANTPDISVQRLTMPPIDRLQQVLERGEAELDQRRAELTEVRHALLQLSSELAQPASGRPSPVWELLSAEMAPPLLRALTHQAERSRGLIRSCVIRVDVGPGLDEESVRQTQGLLAARRIRQRTLYPVDVTHTAEGRTWVQSWAAAGEEQRVSVSPPSDFAIFGGDAVMAVSEWGNAAADYVLIREPMIVAAFVALFDRAFERALPLAVDADGGPSSDQGSNADVQLLRLLGLGLKDESIARYLGCSLRTVRRRVAHLMNVHGAQTRFQLGVAAAREDIAPMPARGA